MKPSRFKQCAASLFLSSLVLGAGVLALPAMAAPDAAAKPGVSSMLETRGYKIERQFDAGHGLKGLVISKDGQKSIVFTTADGKLMMVGALVDDSGANLTEGFIDKYASNPNLPAAYDAFSKSKYIAVKPPGAPRRVIYVVFDANCPYCSVAYTAMKQYVNLGVEFRYVPVAYLKADSANRAAAIMDAPDPSAALDQNEAKFDTDKHLGGIPPSAQVSEGDLKTLKDNDQIMQRIGASATPTFVWKDDDGRFHEFSGLPPAQTVLQMVGINTPH